MNTAAITTWISTAEATTLIKNLIIEGKFTKKQIKKSSYRWADIKDHSKGYICRVMVEAGIHPELELEAKPKANVLKTLEKAAAKVSEQFKSKLEKMNVNELKAFADERNAKLDARMKKMSKDKRPMEKAKTQFINALLAVKAA